MNNLYAIRFFSTMNGIEAYAFFETTEEADKAFADFKVYLTDEDETEEATKRWLDFTTNGYDTCFFDNEMSDYMIGYTKDNQAVFVCDSYAIPFILYKNYVDRF